IAEGKDITVNALCLNSGWSLLLIREVKETNRNQTPILVSFKRKDNDKLDLSFALEPAGQNELRNDAWDIKTNFNEVESHNAIRGKGYYWNSNRDQHPGMYFEVDLKSVHHISRIQWSSSVFVDGSIHSATPRSLHITYSTDGLAWRDAYIIEDERDLSMENDKIIIHVGGIPARWLRLTLTQVALKPWIISECQVFENTTDVER
ncbi:MAG: type domain, partial [Herbinix sp.]|nr:type domain [Herbinix sp.]